VFAEQDHSATAVRKLNGEAVKEDRTLCQFAANTGQAINAFFLTYVYLETAYFPITVVKAKVYFYAYVAGCSPCGLNGNSNLRSADSGTLTNCFITACIGRCLRRTCTFTGTCGGVARNSSLYTGVNGTGIAIFTGVRTDGYTRIIDTGGRSGTPQVVICCTISIYHTLNKRDDVVYIVRKSCITHGRAGAPD
jgi:hypothetical protein